MVLLYENLAGTCGLCAKNRHRGNHTRDIMMEEAVIADVSP